MKPLVSHYITQLSEATGVPLIGQDWELAQSTVDTRALFTLPQIKAVAFRAKLASILSPVIQAGVDVNQLFTFGQGFSVTSENPEVQKVLNDFMYEVTNYRTLFGARALTQRANDLHTEGNIFWWFHTGSGIPKLRVIHLSEIVDIITNPEDSSEIRFYIRSFIDHENKPRKRAYPDVAYAPPANSRPDTYNYIGEKIQIRWETPVYHSLINPVGKYGLCGFLAALTWAKEYEHFLENRATLYAAYAALALLAKSSVSGQDSYRSVLSADSEKETPGIGGTLLMGENDSLEPLRTKDVTTPPSEGIQFLEMVMMSFGYPPHLFGKEEPGGMGESGRHKAFFLRIQASQEGWKYDLYRILDYVIIQAVKAGVLKGEVITTGDTESIKWPPDYDASFSIAFPPLEEDDMTQALDSLIKVTTMNGQKPTGHISPRQFIKLASSYFGLDELELDSVPENWPAAEEDLLVFQEALTTLGERLAQNSLNLRGL